MPPRACLCCSRSHLKCSNTRPCDRCVKRGIPQFCTTASYDSISWKEEGLTTNVNLSESEAWETKSYDNCKVDWDSLMLADYANVLLEDRLFPNIIRELIIIRQQGYSEESCYRINAAFEKLETKLYNIYSSMKLDDWIYSDRRLFDLLHILDSAMHAQSSPMIIASRSSKIIRVNLSFSEIVGIAAENLVGKSMQSYMVEESWVNYVELLCPLLGRLEAMSLYSNCILKRTLPEGTFPIPTLVCMRVFYDVIGIPLLVALTFIPLE